MTSREARLAASNSVDWYASMFRAHGRGGAVADGIWTSRAIAPPYYSNAVTLAPEPTITQLETLRGLAAALGRPFSVKDSFAVLDLAPLGLRPLFDAEWIRRDPSAPIPRSENVDVRWRRVTMPRELSRWEAAWRANGSPAASCVFLPGLLTDETVAVFAAQRGDEIVAGCVANRSADVVGFSNFFAAPPDADALVASAVDEVARFAPGLPVVGYERGDALDRAEILGFRAVGPLRVWIFDCERA